MRFLSGAYCYKMSILSILFGSMELLTELRDIILDLYCEIETMGFSEPFLKTYFKK
jgi:hypothetical protein